ncbi:hypothetical protein OIV83_002083 [Microbotryomycetes sp. JL201]|nr:hypothetical protein OIV83_002083 [Microbotryomycetes sp. JL201]
MKYGKQFQETLNSPGIPDEWRKQAIEYHKLKKVLNRVASELASLGLTSDVLRDLLGSTLQTQSSQSATPGESKSARRADTQTLVRELSSDSLAKSVGASASVHSVDDSLVGESSEDDDHAKPNGLSDKQKGKRKARRRRRAHASYELAGTSESPQPRIHIVFSSASSGSESYSSSTDSIMNGVDRLVLGRDSSEESSSQHDVSRFTELPASSEDDEQEQHSSSGGGQSASADAESADASDEIDGDFENAGPQTNALLKRMYGHGRRSDEEDEDENEDVAAAWRQVGVDVEGRDKPIPNTTLQRTKSDATLRHGSFPRRRERTANQANMSNDNVNSVHSMLSDPEHGTEADDEDDRPSKPRKRRHRHRQHRKEVVIPLTSDNEFLSLLAKALASLAALHAAQKLQFKEAVQALADEVSHVSSPNRPKSDLYIWREIFSLWVQTEIFESERERDRGERSTDEVERKLDWFVDQVAKRKLAKQMRNKASRAALEKFINLNVELLEMKKFQLANEEAARKILKKHDKRTALTAQLGFPKFIASSSDLFREGDGPGGSNTRVLTLPGFPSLPHVLLSTFTTTLLPVIPQIEDYECSICGEVAYKPIRLECGHKFCGKFVFQLRCLVKMQKRGQDSCPQCRAPVVLRANASNLDLALQSYLQLWFPKEVKLKDNANRKEAAREELQEMGLPEGKCAVQ